MVDQKKLNAAAEKLAGALYYALTPQHTIDSCKEVLSTVLELAGDDASDRLFQHLQYFHREAFAKERALKSPPHPAPAPNCPVCGLSLVARDSESCDHHPAFFCSDDEVAWRRGRDGCVIHLSQDSTGPYIRKRVKATQDGKDILVVDFWLRGNVLEMQVIEQDERLRAAAHTLLAVDEYRILSANFPQLWEKHLYVRGAGKEGDDGRDSYRFLTPALALAALRKWMEIVPQVRLPEVKPEFAPEDLAARLESWRHWRRAELGLMGPEEGIFFRDCAMCKYFRDGDPLSPRDSAGRGMCPLGRIPCCPEWHAAYRAWFCSPGFDSPEFRAAAKVMRLKIESTIPAEHRPKVKG